MQSLKIKITGKVYHTGYRYFLKQKATQFNISGCVYYCSDRSAEILASGEKDHLDDFIRHCRSGNKDSNVKEVNLSEIPPAVFESFEVIDDEPSVYS